MDDISTPSITNRQIASLNKKGNLSSSNEHPSQRVLDFVKQYARVYHIQSRYSFVLN